MPPTISDYYRNALEQVKAEIEGSPDASALAFDTGEWRGYFVAKYGMQPIELDVSRPVGGFETETATRVRGYNIYSDAHPGSIVRQLAITIEQPVLPSDTLEVIWKMKLAPSTYSISYSYPPFEYDHGQGLFKHTVAPDEDSLRRGFELIKTEVDRYNVSIQNDEPRFREEVSRLINEKRERVAAKHQGLDALAATVGIPLRKKADTSTVVPTAIRIRPAIAPVMPPKPRPGTRPVLEAEKFAAVLDLIDNSGRQFELTPQVFQVLPEEGLRDVILGNLNGVFEGAAAGETFQRVGKVDIHLRIDNGAALVAEIKFWDGRATLQEVVRQLRERLTWRDSFGIAIVFSRNARFSDVLTGVAETLPNCTGFVKRLANAKGENHFVARFSIAADEAKQATFHVLVYNLFTAEPGKRTVKRATKPPTL